MFYKDDYSDRKQPLECPHTLAAIVELAELLDVHPNELAQQLGYWKPGSTRIGNLCINSLPPFAPPVPNYTKARHYLNDKATGHEK